MSPLSRLAAVRLQKGERERREKGIYIACISCLLTKRKGRRKYQPSISEKKKKKKKGGERNADGLFSAGRAEGGLGNLHGPQKEGKI